MSRTRPNVFVYLPVVGNVWKNDVKSAFAVLRKMLLDSVVTPSHSPI